MKIILKEFVIISLERNAKRYMKNIIFIDKDDFSLTLFNDIIKRKDTCVIKTGEKPNNKLVAMLKKVHLSDKINKIINLPLKHVWFDMARINKNVEKSTVFLFPNFTLAKDIPVSVLHTLKKKYPYNKFVAILVDSLNSHSVSNIYTKEKLNTFDWDMVLSFDKRDCDEYGFTFIGNHYYSVVGATVPLKIEKDIMYVGRQHPNDGREKIVESIYARIKNKVNCDFTIVGGHNLSAGIKTSNSIINYAELTKKIRTSNCILEILQDGQQQQTIRPFEAVVSNKKLLTNNPNITKFEYYNPEYMRYFRTVDDIDINWIKDKTKINYNYKGDFSPVYLLKLIEKCR